jgi:hypothetical protein
MINFRFLSAIYWTTEEGRRKRQRNEECNWDFNIKIAFRAVFEVTSRGCYV